jgi:hypothetical protein
MFNGDGAPLLHTPRKLATSLSRPAIERAAGQAIEEFEQVGDGRDRGLGIPVSARARAHGRPVENSIFGNHQENRTWAS